MRVELEERIDGQKLDACALVQNIAGNACEDLLHHPVRAPVAVLEGLTEQQAVGIHQPIIDGPAIHPDAVERAG